jgi:hypothetical protein
LDRIDIHVEVPRIDYEKLSDLFSLGYPKAGRLADVADSILLRPRLVAAVRSSLPALR